MDDYSQIMDDVLRLTGVDLRAYRERACKRNIDRQKQAHQFSSLAQYRAALAKDEQLQRELTDSLTPAVSEYFRNPPVWNDLNTCLPELIDRFGPGLKVWSAACGWGEEPYSLVLTLSEFLPLGQIDVLATDFSSAALDHARSGRAAASAVTAVDPRLLKTYFTQSNDSYHISPEIMERVRFARHNLLSDEYPQHCHLIACRNVLPYFSDEAKSRVIERLAAALAPHGILFIGSTEMIPNCAALGLEKKAPFLFEKR